MKFKILCIVLVLYIHCLNVHAIYVDAPSSYIVDDVIWFESTGNHLICCWSDGAISVIDIKDGKKINNFKINDFNIMGHQLYISYVKKPLLACVSGSGRVALYDILTGDTKKNFKVTSDPNAVVIEGLGFSNDGEQMYFHSAGVSRVWCVMIDSGKVIWEDCYGPYRIWGGSVLVPNQGDSYVLCIDHSLIARNNKSQELWNRDRGKYTGFFWEHDNPPFACTEWQAQPVGPTDVAILYIKKDESLAAMNMDNGKIIWKKKEDVCGELRAVTANKSRQAFYKNNQLLLTNYPKSKSLVVKGINYEVNAIFSHDGNSLMCLPKLKKIKQERITNIATLDRDSNIAKIIDFNSGKIVREISLEKPR